MGRKMQEFFMPNVLSVVNKIAYLICVLIKTQATPRGHRFWERSAVRRYVFAVPIKNDSSYQSDKSCKKCQLILKVPAHVKSDSLSNYIGWFITVREIQPFHLSIGNFWHKLSILKLAVKFHIRICHSLLLVVTFGLICQNRYYRRVARDDGALCLVGACVA